MSNLPNLSGLSEREQQEVLKILEQFSIEGKSELFDNLLYQDYREIPVDIETFIHNSQYLGSGLTDAEGRFTLYPYWEELLKKIYPDPLKPATYNTLALTGAIGIGKSTEAVIIGLYELYRMMCLKDPYVYYGIMNIDTISFAVINITLDAAQGVAWDKMQNLLQSSPWFLAHGTLSKAEQPIWRPNTDQKIELICGSQPRHFIGRALYWSFFDEISFIQNQDVEKQKEKATLLISSATARMQSRFMKGEVNPTIMVLASSKRTEQSFLETWIENKKKNESKTTYIVDEPQWVIRTDKNSERTFKVAIGNKFLSSEILPLNIDEEELSIYRNRGFRIIDVPMGYYENFLDDIDIALTDIAGISTTNLSTYISGERLAQAKFEGRNAFMKDIITVGNGIDDKTQYSDFFDLSEITPEMKSKPLFIHLDMSLTGDKTGIAGVWIKGKRPPQEGVPASKEVVFQLAFCVSVKAPKGHQVSFEKNRNFIRWLRDQGFRIKGITCDTFQSASLLQELQAEGFNAGILSVDRVKDNVCEPYQYVKSAIYEQRLLIPNKGTTLLTEEFLGLERNNNNGKIDHSPNSINSKDSADAVTGACYTASQHAEEYAFDYGEDLSLVVKVSSGNSNEKQQMIVDFENEMKNALNPMNTTDRSVFQDFGFGKAQPMTSMSYLSEGIILW